MKLNPKHWPWLLGALLCALLLAAFVSPYASSSPDGLERVAADKGFLAKSETRPPAWRHAPLAAFAFPGLKHPKLATGLAGLTGTLLVFGVAWGVARFASTRRAAASVPASCPKDRP